MSSFFSQKSLFARVFIYLLTKAGSTATQKRVPQSLFPFLSVNLLIKGLEGVHLVNGIVKRCTPNNISWCKFNVPVDFDTMKKAFSGVKTADKGI